MYELLKNERWGKWKKWREGNGWMWRVMERMVKGKEKKSEIEMMLEVKKKIEGKKIWEIGDEEEWKIKGMIRNLSKEIEKRIDEYNRKEVKRSNISMEEDE